MVMDKVLYYVDRGEQHRLRIAVPQKFKETLMKEAHGGPFGGHFAAKGPKNTVSAFLVGWYVWRCGEVV